ncbi:MAG: C40 family peptidase [Bacteroidetes bacterium]|nr:C40 family peptidase [Bacteroidota bacterium]
MYGICNLSIVPCRKSPSDRSEMVTQLLFGETFEIIEEQKKWVKINNSFDSYISWIDKKQYQSITQKTYNTILKEPIQLASDLVRPLMVSSTGNALPIVLGSQLPSLKGTELKIEDILYEYDGQTVKAGLAKKTRATIIQNAYLYLNAPYLWGGRSPFGIDCSGFTQMVLKLSGINILRDASQQVEGGQSIDFIDEARPGDLAFFDNDAGKIIHVGILLGNSQIIHASGKVRVDKFDHYGIFNEEKNGYTHQLRIIKSFV